MAKVVLIALEHSTASQICRVLDTQQHEIELKPIVVSMDELVDADIVFVGGDRRQYMPLLKSIRETRHSLPFVVVTRVPETSDWLDALEAGATDYCSAPFESRQINWLMESVFPRLQSAAA